MKAVYLTQTGSPDVLIYSDLPAPSPGPNDVLIRVRACSLNRLDVFTREGSQGTRITPPHVLGGDFAGEVVRVGEGVAGFQAGDKVIANGRSGYAELAFAGGPCVSATGAMHV
jgi:NADPH:quinone reductase-like Zn-dependent oxidoreductase